MMPDSRCVSLSIRVGRHSIVGWPIPFAVPYRGFPIDGQQIMTSFGFDRKSFINNLGDPLSLQEGRKWRQRGEKDLRDRRTEGFQGEVFFNLFKAKESVAGSGFMIFGSKLECKRKFNQILDWQINHDGIEEIIIKVALQESSNEARNNK